MMIYLDRSFCLAFTDGRCVNSDCYHAFTDVHATKSADWAKRSGFDVAPIGMADISPDCEIMITPKAAA